MIPSSTRDSARSLEDILQRAGAVPSATVFPSVDALNARFAAIEAAHPELVTSKQIATSRLGEPIRIYSIGASGGAANSTAPSLSHLIVGGVHPNEPIGSLTAIHLAEQLTQDAAFRISLDATWHIIPCIDPDGARLNEAWYSQPGDRTYYSRRFYRPAPDQQVEWTFPTDYKRAYFDRVLPETQGLIRALDDVRPDLYVSLHNGEMGGVYYYLSRPEPGLYEALAAVPASLGLPLDTGEPESPYLEQYAPAIFGTGTISMAYDYLEELGVDPTEFVGGSSSSEYALRYGTLGLVAELPYWSHPDADDRSELAESYSDLVLRTAAGMRITGESLGEILTAAEPMLKLDTPFLSASRAFVPMMVSMAETDVARAALPAAQRPATVAERFGCEDLVHCFRLRYGGMLLRALESEVVAGIAPAELRALTGRLGDLYSQWQADAAAIDTTEVIPIAKLVGVQYGAILAAADLLQRTAAEKSAP